MIAEILVGINQGNKEIVNQKIAILVRHPMWRLEPEELWKLALGNFKDPDWLEALQKGNERQKQLGDWLMWLSGRTAFQTLPVTFEHMLGGLVAGEHMTSPVREYYLSGCSRRNICNVCRRSVYCREWLPNFRP